MKSPEHFLLLDIDALRPDVFATALQQGYLPNLGQLLGGPDLNMG